MEESLWEVKNFLIHENIDKDLLNEAMIDDMAYHYYKNCYYYEMDNEYGPPAAGVATLTSHLPSSPATPRYFLPSHEVVTVTFTPGSAHPQTGAKVSRCKTMWSVNTGASVSSWADRVKQNVAITATILKNLLIIRSLEHETYT